MTRNSFRKRPPFPFVNRARTNQLVCDPRSYVRAWQADGRPLWAPCLAWSPGPQALATTGDGSFTTLYGANWLAEICQEGTWRLYQRTADETLTVVPWDVEPPTVSITARHPSLAFDQAAKPAIAWEDADGVRLREFNEFTGQYHFIGPFTGHDPVLMSDAPINYHVPGSDLILYYLSSDRTKLNYRIQSENFAAEHEHFDLEAPSVLDTSDVLMLRYELTYGLDDGSLDGALGSQDALRSLLYPYYATDHQTATMTNFPMGEYQQVVILRTPEAEAVTAVVGNFPEGDYYAVIIVRAPDQEALDAAVANFAEADNAEVVILQSPDVEALYAVVPLFPDADNALVVILREPTPEALDASVSNFAGAEYATA